MRQSGKHGPTAKDSGSFHNRSFFYDSPQQSLIFKGIGTADVAEKSTFFNIPFAVGKDQYLFRGGFFKAERKGQAFASGWLKEKFAEYFNSDDEFFSLLKKEGLEMSDIDMFFTPIAYFQPLMVPISSKNNVLKWGVENAELFLKQLPASEGKVIESAEYQYKEAVHQRSIWDDSFPINLSNKTDPRQIDDTEEIRWADVVTMLKMAGFNDEAINAQEIFLYSALTGHRIQELVNERPHGATGMYDRVTKISEAISPDSQFLPFYLDLNVIVESLANYYGCQKKDFVSRELREKILKKLVLKSLALARVLWKEGYAGSTDFGNIFAPHNMSFLGFFDYDTIGKGISAQTEDIAFLIETLSIAAYSLDLQEYWLDGWGIGSKTRTFFDEGSTGLHPLIKFVFEFLKDSNPEAFENFMRKKPKSHDYFSYGSADSEFSLDIPFVGPVVDGIIYDNVLADVLEGARQISEASFIEGQSDSSPITQNKGGIDLNPENLDMEIRGKGISSPVINNIPFNLDNFQGFTFQILNIKHIDDIDSLFAKEDRY